MLVGIWDAGAVLDSHQELTGRVIQRDDATITHEATVGKINSDVLFYLMSRGIPENEALALVVMGFFDEFTKELPMEYAVELNRLVEMEMEGSVG